MVDCLAALLEVSKGGCELLLEGRPHYELEGISKQRNVIVNFVAIVWRHNP